MNELSKESDRKRDNIDTCSECCTNGNDAIHDNCSPAAAKEQPPLSWLSRVLQALVVSSSSLRRGERVDYEYDASTTKKKARTMPMPMPMPMSMSILAIYSFYQEIQRKKSLSALPLIYHQHHHEKHSHNHHHDALTICSLMSDMLLRKYTPSLFVGTRSMLNSVLAYMKPGPTGPGPVASSTGICDSDESHQVGERWRKREIVNMTRDGGTVALDWEFPEGHDEDGDGNGDGTSVSFDTMKITRPIVLILHGTNTDASFGYMRSMMNSCTELGWIAIGMNARGSGRIDLTTNRTHNAAYTNDLRHVVDLLCSRFSESDSKKMEAKLFLVGFSMGANTLVKYLGEMGDEISDKIGGAISLSNPMNIDHSKLESPWRQIITSGAKKSLRRHQHTTNKFTDAYYQECIKKIHAGTSSLADISAHMAPHLIRSSTLPPYHTSVGYTSAEEYWNEASCHHFIPHVKIPLLVVYANDDPIASRNTASALVLGKLLANPNIIVVSTPCGGHMGWHTTKGNNPLGSYFFRSCKEADKSWGDRVTTRFISSIMEKDMCDAVAVGAGVGIEYMHGVNRNEIAAAVRKDASLMRSRL